MLGSNLVITGAKYKAPDVIDYVDIVDGNTKIRLIDENSGSGADLEDNKTATIDVSTYTEPVEVTPTSGKDGMKKVTVTLSNIPSGSLPAPYCYAEFSGFYTTIVFSGPTELVSVSEDGESWYNDFELVQWQSDDLSFGLHGDRVVLQSNHRGYNAMAVVTPAGTENPQEEGWYEKSGNYFSSTSDASVDPNKTYYINFYASHAKYSNGGETYTVDFNNSWDDGPLTPDA